MVPISPSTSSLTNSPTSPPRLGPLVVAGHAIAHPHALFSHHRRTSTRTPPSGAPPRRSCARKAARAPPPSGSTRVTQRKLSKGASAPRAGGARQGRPQPRDHEWWFADEVAPPPAHDDEPEGLDGGLAILLGLEGLEGLDGVGAVLL